MDITKSSQNYPQIILPSFLNSLLKHGLPEDYVEKFLKIKKPKRSPKALLDKIYNSEFDKPHPLLEILDYRLGDYKLPHKPPVTNKIEMNKRTVDYASLGTILYYGITSLFCICGILLFLFLIIPFWYEVEKKFNFSTLKTIGFMAISIASITLLSVILKSVYDIITTVSVIVEEKYEYKTLMKNHENYIKKVSEIEKKNEIDYDEQLILYNREVQERKGEIIFNLINDFDGNVLSFSEQKTFDKKGKSEAFFIDYLKKHFGEEIYWHTSLNVEYRSYAPDFILKDSETNMHFDIEIDEPYLLSGEPIHYIGSDDNRNAYFFEKHWITIRLTEQQVYEYPNECCELIKNLINGIKNYEKDIKCEVKKQKRWTFEEAEHMYKQNYRNGYINY